MKVLKSSNSVDSWLTQSASVCTRESSHQGEITDITSGMSGRYQGDIRVVSGYQGYQGGIRVISEWYQGIRDIREVSGCYQSGIRVSGISGRYQGDIREVSG